MENDILISRIINGYLYMPEYGLKIYYPSRELEYEWLLIKSELIQTFDSLDSYTLSNVTGTWDARLEEELNFSQEEIDNLKAQLFKCFFNPSQASTVRSKIREEKQKLLKLQRTRSILDKYSIEGVTEHSRLAFFIERNTYKNNILYNWSDCDIIRVMDFWENNYISEQSIRLLARCDEWNSIYNSSKNLHIPIFNTSASLLNDDQKRLITWSNIYYSVNQMSEGPQEEIINDDDAFDGFLITKRREVKSKNRYNSFESALSESQRNAEELYLVPDPRDLSNSLKKIRESNNRAARMKMDARRDAIMKLKKGETIKHGGFPDVKQRMIIEANKAEKMRGV